MNNRTLGQLIVRLGVELGQYKADWNDAARTTKDGAGRVEEAARDAAGAQDKLTDAAKRSTGALGDVASEAKGYMDAARAASGASVALASAVGVAAASVLALGVAWHKGQQDQRAMDDALTLTGNYARAAAGEIDRLAHSVAQGLGGQVAASREVLVSLAATGKFTVESLSEVASAVQQVARFSGKTNDQVVRDFAGMADGVADWAAKANEAYHFLDAPTYRYIRALETQGQKQEAMRVTSEALNQHLGGSLARNLGLLERLWRGVMNAASNAWDAMKGVGRDKGLSSDIAALESYIDKARGGLGARSEGGKAQIEMMERRLQSLKAMQAAEQDALRTQTEKANADGKAIENSQKWADVLARARKEQKTLNEALREARDLAKAEGASSGELASVEAYIKAGYARRTRTKDPEDEPAYKAAMRAAEERQKLRIKEDEQIAKHFQTQEELSRRAADKAIEDARRRSDEYQRGIDQQVAAARKAVDAAEWEALTHGKQKSEIAELTLARLEDAKAQILMTALTEKDVEVINAQIEAQKRLVQAFRNVEYREEGEKAAKATAQAWRDTGKFIEDTLLQSVQRGFESGERFSKGFFRSLEATAKTTVLRFGVQLTSQALGFGGSAGGVAGAANAAGGVMNMVGSAGSLLGLGGAGSAVGSVAGLFGTAGNAYLGTSMGLGAGSSAAAASAAAAAGGANAATASALATAGSSIAAAMPYIGVALLAAQLLTGDRGGPKVEGGYNVAGMSRGDTSGAKAIADGYNAAYRDTAAALGLRDRELNAGVFFAKDPEGDALTQFEAQGGGYSRANRLGGFENVGRSDQELQAAVAEEQTQLVFRKLRQATDLAADLKAILDAVTDTAGTAEMQAALDRVLRIKSERTELEARLLNLTGTAAEKLARTRDAERLAVDATNRALLEQIYAQEDLAAATQETTRIQSALRNGVVQAENDVRQAYAATKAEKQAYIAQERAYADQLRQYRAGLRTSDSSPYGVEDRTADALRTYEDTLARANAGDSTARQALQGASSAYLQALAVSSATGREYASGFAKVQEDLRRMANTALANADVAQLELDALTASVQTLLEIRDGVMTLPEALARLVGARSAAAANGVGLGPSSAGALYASRGNFAPDAEGMAYWGARLASGEDPAAVQAAFNANFDYVTRVNGSHAGGLEYVPFNGYVAQLHEGERVQTAAEASAWRAGGYSSGAELVAAVRAQEQLLGYILAAVRAGAATAASTHELLDQVSAGGNAWLVENAA